MNEKGGTRSYSDAKCYYMITNRSTDIACKTPGKDTLGIKRDAWTVRANALISVQ